MRKLYRRALTFLPVILLLLLSFFGVSPLLNTGFFSMHDDQQIARLFELDKSLASGQFPVRWIDGLGFGYGYPLFNFYPPLTYYLGEIYHQLPDIGIIDATKLVWFTALAGSAIAMYFLSKEFFGKAGGAISAAFYLYAPYHAVDAYVRGAQAELFSFVWLPLVLLFSYKMIKEQSFKWSMVTGSLLTLLMLTHNLIFLPFVGLYFLWAIFITAIYNRQQSIRSLAYSVFSVFLSFGLSAFFWLPALAEKRFTLVDQLLIKNLASYKIHFLCWPQLWDSPWGFGGSNPGCLDGVSFKIGKLHLLLSGISTLVAAYLWKRNLKLSLTILAAAVLLLFSAFMTTTTSQFIWDRVSQLWYLQFPWRFLEFTVLFATLLCGAIVIWTKKSTVQWLIAAAAIAATIYLNGRLFAPQTYRPQATDSELTSYTEIKWNVSSTSFEFMSKDVATTLNDKGVVWVDINRDQIQKTNFIVRMGDWQSTSENFVPGKFLVSGTSKKGTTLEFQISNFPGWKLWLDNNPVDIDDNNKYRLLSVSVPPGNHTVVGRFTNTPVRTIGNTVSIIFALFLVGLFLTYGTRRTRS